MKQRLAAILAADAAGYSRSMAADEQATVAALDAGRLVFRHQIEANQGRVIDMAGDSVLAVFETAAGAVRAAVAIQKELAASRLRFRIGLHLGDVIEKPDGTVYGDGVNIAARLEGLAEPGGIAASDAVRSAVRGRVSAEFTDLGEQQVKNIPHTVRTFRVRPEGPYTASSSPSGSSPDRPSIAVLPFKVLTEDASIGFFADGLAEDVIALLARMPGFCVISQGSSFAFRTSNATLADIAEQLGVRYIVEGSVRPVEDRIRISMQLTDARTGRMLWSGRLEGKREAAEDFQDRIARGIITELEPELTRAEISLIRRQRPENIDAWSCYRQALGAIALRGWSEEAVKEALANLRQAMSIDPDFGLAHAYYALLAALGKTTGLSLSFRSLANDAIEAAKRAIALDDGSSQVLGYAGCALADLGDHEYGIEILQRAVELDPSNAQAHVALGAALAISGRADAGIERMRHGMGISPRDRRLGFWGWALAALLLRAGKIEESLQEARTAARQDPGLYLPRIVEAAALVALERVEDAGNALVAARRLRPSLTLPEVELSHGRRLASALKPIWKD